jgi:hypothetical protein
MARYVYAYEKKPYYARIRSYEMPDGTTARALTTRYTYEQAMRSCKGPRGGKAYRPFYRNVYYYDGKFYRAANMQHADGSYYNTLAPITGGIYEIPTSNRSSKKNAGVPVASIICENGTPKHIMLEGVEMPMSANAWAYCAELLGLETPDEIAA